MNKLTLGIVVLLAGALVSFFNCSGSKADKEQEQAGMYDFELIKSVELSVDAEEATSERGFQYAVIDEIETAIFYILNNNNKLSFYDLNTGEKYHEIKLDRRLEKFQYVSKDSIYILYSDWNHKEYFFDSTQFVRINFNGEILQYYSFNDKLIRTEENPVPIDSSIIIYPSLFDNRLYKSGNDVFFSSQTFNIGAIGTKEFMQNKNKYPLILKYNIDNQEVSYTKKLWLPGIEEGVYYPSDIPLFHYCLSKNNYPIVRFFYSSQLYEWDYNSDKINEYSLKSSFIDSIYLCNKPCPYSDKLKAKYTNMLYDPYRKLYFSFLYFSDDYYKSKHSIIIADENLNYIGEIFSPKMSDDFFFTEDYIISGGLIWKDKKLVVNYYKLEKKEGNFTAYVDSVRNVLDNEIKMKTEVK